MFRDLISNPIDPIPEEYVKTINHPDYEPDFALTCLGIALYKHRFEDYQGIKGEYGRMSSSNEAIRRFIEKDNNEESVPQFYYYYVSTWDDSVDEFKQELFNNGFKEKESIEKLIKDKANTNCIAFYHEDRNCAGIVINSSDIKLYHILISFQPLYYPSLFKDNPMQPKEYELVKTLSKTNSEEFIKKVSEIVEPHIESFRRVLLNSMLKSMHNVKINKAYNNVVSQRQAVNNYLTQYSEAMDVLRDYIVKYEGMKAVEQVDKPEEELVECLAEHKDIHNLKIDNERLYFSVATTLTNYNEEAWRIFSQRGNIYDGEYKCGYNDVFKVTENRKILFDSIFSEDPEFTVKIAGNYRLHMTRNTVTTFADYDYAADNPLYKSYLPNPHLKIFACLGGYEPRIMDALRDEKYVVAIELCVASAGSVDLDETEQTFRPFLGWILASEEKILRRKDGVEMTPQEALIYLIDKEKAE